MYKTFIISLINSGVEGDHKLSAQEWAPRVQHLCEKYSWSYTMFSAINGYTLVDQDWLNFGFDPPNKKSSKPGHFSNLPGAQGCFLSHYTLWKKCIEINEPIIILEDDAEVLEKFNTVITDKELLKLHAPRKKKQSPTLGEWSAGAFGYLLFPVGALKLINYSNKNGPGHADKLIASNIVNWGYIEKPVIKLGMRIGSSTNPQRYPYSFNY